MTIVGYKKGKLIGQAAGCMAVAIGSAWAFTQFDDVQPRILFGCLAIALPVVGIALGLRAASDLVALRFDTKGVTVATLWRQSSFVWRNVKSIHREELQQSSGYGLFKQTIGWYLVIVTHEGDGFEQRHKLDEKLLDWPHREIDGLVALLCSAWLASSGEGPAPKPDPVRSAGIPPAQPEFPARPSFGRKVA